MWIFIFYYFWEMLSSHLLKYCPFSILSWDSINHLQAFSSYYQYLSTSLTYSTSLSVCAAF